MPFLFNLQYKTDTKNIKRQRIKKLKNHLTKVTRVASAAYEHTQAASSTSIHPAVLLSEELNTRAPQLFALLLAASRHIQMWSGHCLFT